MRTDALTVDSGTLSEWTTTARQSPSASGIFEMIRIMNEAMTRYERTFGEIRPPGDEA